MRLFMNGILFAAAFSLVGWSIIGFIILCP